MVSNGEQWLFHATFIVANNALKEVGFVAPLESKLKLFWIRHLEYISHGMQRLPTSTLMCVCAPYIYDICIKYAYIHIPTYLPTEYLPTYVCLYVCMSVCNTEYHQFTAFSCHARFNFQNGNAFHSDLPVIFHARTQHIYQLCSLVEHLSTTGIWTWNSSLKTPFFCDSFVLDSLLWHPF